VTDQHAAELRSAQRRLIEAGDAARQRLSRDIHDGPQQQFVAAIIGLQLAQRKWESDPERARQHLDSARTQAESGLSALRDLVVGIHPPVLTHLGLAPAVQAVVAQLPIPVDLDVTDTRLPPPIETTVYYFISEALTNTIKHADASAASIRVAVEDGHVFVDVHDDGIGGATVSGVGTGLLGLADRIGGLDGAFGVTSLPGAGTTLHAEIPVA
jgi:signal transduction histidine kinase